MVGLLFFALVIFAFGQADAARNSNQSAADSAALAAAQKSRDQLKPLFLANVLDPGWLEGILNGSITGRYDGCAQASRFAELNDAGTIDCEWLRDGRWGFSVVVQSNKTMGKSILPGTDKPAKSRAIAVVEPRCSFQPVPGAGSPSPRPTTTLPAPPGGGSGGNGGHKPPSPGTISCDDRDWQIDPDHLDLLPDMADLFTVRLAEN